MQNKVVVTAILILLSCISKAQNKADDIIGVWLTSGKEPAKIHVYKSGKNFMVKLSG